MLKSCNNLKELFDIIDQYIESIKAFEVSYLNEKNLTDLLHEIPIERAYFDPYYVFDDKVSINYNENNKVINLILNQINPDMFLASIFVIPITVVVNFLGYKVILQPFIDKVKFLKQFYIYAILDTLSYNINPKSKKSVTEERVRFRVIKTNVPVKFLYENILRDNNVRDVNNNYNNVIFQIPLQNYEELLLTNINNADFVKKLDTSKFIVKTETRTTIFNMFYEVLNEKIDRQIYEDEDVGVIYHLLFKQLQRDNILSENNVKVSVKINLTLIPKYQNITLYDNNGNMFSIPLNNVYIYSNQVKLIEPNTNTVRCYLDNRTETIKRYIMEYFNSRSDLTERFKIRFKEDDTKIILIYRDDDDTVLSLLEVVLQRRY